jgi:hypothetical protein
MSNLAEEFFDFLDSPTWHSLVGIMKVDAISRRRLLMTSYTLPDEQRHGSIAVLKAYRDLCGKVYEVAERKMPPELLELFTGSPNA